MMECDQRKSFEAAKYAGRTFTFSDVGSEMAKEGDFAASVVSAKVENVEPRLIPIINA
jgi:hypothetical protein